MIVASWLLLAAVAGEAKVKVWRTVKEPVAMACVNVYEGELKVREFVMSDTATTVRLTMTYAPGRAFRMVRSSYLADEGGHRYPLRTAEGIRLDENVVSPGDGTTDFTMHFEPLPKGTRTFDFIGGDGPRPFMVLGVHDVGQKLKAPTAEELRRAYPYTVPETWFRMDTVTIRGRIEDYDAGRFGFTSMECSACDVFARRGTLMLNIAEDGSFERRFPLSHPVRNAFVQKENADAPLMEIPFYACPGDTIDITVKPDENGRYRCHYNSGSSKTVERWLHTNMRVEEVCQPLPRMADKKVDEARQIAERVGENLRYRLAATARQAGFTPMEVQLALACAQVQLALDWTNYLSQHKLRLNGGDNPLSRLEDAGADSTEWRAVTSVEGYTSLHGIDFDNPMHFVHHYYDRLINNLQFAPLARERQWDIMNEMDEDDYTYDAPHGERMLHAIYATLRELMATDHDNLLAQMCAYREMVAEYDWWEECEENVPEILSDTAMSPAEREAEVARLPIRDNLLPVYLASFAHPFVREQAERFHAEKLAREDKTSPLPEDNPAADLIRSLLARYPGRYLYLDFWAMWCLPCRSAIQGSKSLRAELAGRDDVKLVFIADEATAEGSEAYRKYVAEWLAGEETICLPHADYVRFMELFSFMNIPHYETITPDGRRVREEYAIHHYENFDYQLQSMKERLGK